MILLGHDRESYEYSLGRANSIASSSKSTSPPTSEWLLKLEGPLDSVAAVRDLAGLAEDPQTFNGTDDADGDAMFVHVHGLDKDLIMEKLAGAFTPTFVRLAKASKCLSTTSLHPKLGIDVTLPQFRPDQWPPMSAQDVVLQDEYPVWYFFYGTLAEPDRLARSLGLTTPPKLERASVSGGIIKTWAGIYRALVDGDVTDKTDGWAYLVDSKQHEDSLRYYETDNYEVVRCDIQMEDGQRKGLTFRFVHSARLA